MINVNHILQLQQQKTIHWQDSQINIENQDFLALVEQNHSYNFQLWYQEDKARREDKGFEYVYKAKRQIDGFNQKRNDMIEAMDQWLAKNLNPKSHDQAPVNSETPGMMIDRLSILALKKYHMELQTKRDDASPEHISKCQHKLLVIEQQLQQLSACLSELLQQISEGTRTFRLYHQFKMYNDPSLNPQLYAKERA